MDQETIKDILFDALALPESERDAFIEAQCDDRSAASRVRELLTAYDGAAATANDVEVDTAALSEERRPDELAGRRVVRTLGEGGYGLVYLAEESAPIERRVAIKVIRPGYASSDIATRFEAERRVLAMMNHPGIAQVFEAGATDRGEPYVVMEYVDGPPITHYCRINSLPIESRVELIEGVCLAVQHAHQKGVIHRDIKPSNVLVAESDGKPVPKVIDFGIAKAVDGPLSGSTPNVTGTRQIIGTPQYMPPEQASFGKASVDTRTDVYALGVLLYECLVGAPPYPPERFATAGAAELERIIRDEEPPRPSARAATLSDSAEHAKLARRLKGELDWIVQRATEKDPARRYASPAALAYDLRRWIKGQAVDAGPPSGMYRARKMVTRHKLEFSFAASVLLLIVAGAVVSLIYAQRANARRIEAERETAKYEAITDFTQGMISGIDPASARGADTALLEKMLTDAETDLADRALENKEVVATLKLMIALAYRSIGDYERALPLAESAMATMDAELGPTAELSMEGANAMGVLYAEHGRFDESLAMLRSTHDRRSALWGPNDERTLEALSNVGGVLYRLQRYEEAAEVHREAHRIKSITLGPRDIDTVSSLNNLAMSLSGMGRRDEIVPMLKEAIEVQTEHLGADSPRVLATRNNLASTYEYLDQDDLALIEFEQILEAKARVLPPSHPSQLTTMGNLANLLIKTGQNQPALDLLYDAIARAREGLPPDDIRSVKLKKLLADTLFGQGKTEEAILLMEEVLASLNATYGPDHELTTISTDAYLTMIEARGSGDQVD